MDLARLAKRDAGPESPIRLTQLAGLVKSGTY